MRAADETIICYGGADAADTHLLATVYAVEIVEWLARRDARQNRTKARLARASN